MVTLTLTEKGGETRQLTFHKDEVTVGRVQGNDVVLPKGNVSKRHCRILLQNGHFSVEDLKSTNGTYINGRKVAEPTLVSSADKIYVGDFIIRVDNAAAGEAASSPGVAEAGSLSTAVPRRPPPPPAPGRQTGAMRTIDDDLGADPPRTRSAERSTLPPPPPSPPSVRRESARPTAPGPEPHDVDLEPPAPADVEIDEEMLAPRPRLPVPPLKPALSSLTMEDEPQEDEEDEEIKTATRKPGVSSPAVASPVSSAAAARMTPPPSGSADAVATWLRQLLEVKGTSVVYVSGSSVEVERQGRREPAEVPAGVPLADAVRLLASRGSPRPSADTRVINVTLPENARLAAIFPPVASAPCATLQRLAPAGRTLADLVDAGVLSKEGRELLEACIGARRNILIASDGRGARTLLQAMAAAIPAALRVVSLVDFLNHPDGANWIRLDAESRVSDILFAAASLQPDYLLVQITAPPMASDVLTQGLLGQEGTIVSLAGRSAADALQRLAALAGPQVGGTAHARELATAAFDLVVSVGTLAGGEERVLEITEPRIDADGQLLVDPLVVWKPEGGGRFHASGTSSRLGASLAQRGARVPAAVARR
jgi:pilus assembly protein CpaF